MMIVFSELAKASKMMYLTSVGILSRKSHLTDVDSVVVDQSSTGFSDWRWWISLNWALDIGGQVSSRAEVEMSRTMGLVLVDVSNFSLVVMSIVWAFMVSASSETPCWVLVLSHASVVILVAFDVLEEVMRAILAGKITS